MKTINENKLKEFEKLSKIRFPGFGPSVDVKKVADTARKLSKILPKQLQRAEERGSSSKGDA